LRGGACARNSPAFFTVILAPQRRKDPRTQWGPCFRMTIKKQSGFLHLRAPYPSDASIPSAARSAIAMIVIWGLTPKDDGTALPSVT
jgi:hypothetical protein